MRTRTFGRTAAAVSEVGFGAWGIGGGLWKGSDDRESTAALRAAIAHGVNFIDTALAYNEGHSERLVGSVCRESPGPIFVATKIPPKNLRWPAADGTPLRDAFPADHIRTCTESSLRHLGVDTIDLQQFHVWSDAWAGDHEWQDAVQQLQQEGKVRHWGISINDHQPSNVLKALDTGLIAAVQVIYNIYDQSPEEALFPYCQKHGIGVIVRVPLDEGGLTGSIGPETTFDEGDFRANYFRGDRKRQVWERTQKLRPLLGEEAKTLPEMALRFTLSHPAVSTIIPGMRTRAHVASNCAISDGRALSPGRLEALKAHQWRRNFYSAG
jgi:aryl-alcohol dehydrogenase-like predicted oxidoreductase